MLQNVPFKVAAANIVWSGQFPMWNPYLFGGMPLLGGAQGGLLFPLNWFYLILSPSLATNVMVLLTYMIAALGAYMFARCTGASIKGAAATSIIWSYGGFLVNQISHINIVHTAALLPWALWLMHLYVRSGRRKHGALLAVVVALQIFAGHQQTFAYALMLLIAYAVVMSIAVTETRKRYLTSLLYCALGILLGAVQILPTWELLRNSVRASASYDYFTSFSMPKLSVMTFLAPFIFGGGDGRIFKAPYIGQSFYTEYVPYAGVVAIMLALIALKFKADRQTKFWGGVVVVGLLLAFGRNAPLSFNRLIYFVPVLNLFRVPARHLMEVHFAVAILAGRGLSCWESNEEKPNATWVAAISILVLLLTVLVVTWWRPAEFRLGRQAPLDLMHAPELFVPIVFAILSVIALWRLARGHRHGFALVLLVLCVDLFIWGQFNGWYASSGRIPEEYWKVPESVSLLKSKATEPRYRILTTHLAFDPKWPVENDNGWVLWTEPDIYMMHGVQNAAGYDGFGLQRYSELAGDMKLWGALTNPESTLRGNSRELDVLSTRYVIARHERDLVEPEASNTTPVASVAGATEKYGDLPFAPKDLSLPALSGSAQLTFKSVPFKTNRIALLTNLSFAETIPDNTVVARLQLSSVDGALFEFSIRAGEHTADWAFDRPDIRRVIKHRRAAVATNFDVRDSAYSYIGHTYVCSFELPAAAEIVSGTLELDPQVKDATLSVFRITLINASEDKAYPLTKNMISIRAASTAVPESSGDERWKLIARGLDVNIYENKRALPQAWMAAEVRELDDQATLHTIRSGFLPDGSKWDPLTTALVQPGVSMTPLQTSGNVGFTRYRANSIKLKTDTSGSSLLVVSENDYPGWKAYVDGKAAPIIRVNYYLRGVVVPAGLHEVSFYYRPLSVIVGAMITVLTAAGLILFCLGARRRTV